MDEAGIVQEMYDKHGYVVVGKYQARMSITPRDKSGRIPGWFLPSGYVLYARLLNPDGRRVEDEQDRLRGEIAIAKGQIETAQKWRHEAEAERDRLLRMSAEQGSQLDAVVDAVERTEVGEFMRSFSPVRAVVGLREDYDTANTSRHRLSRTLGQMTMAVLQHDWITAEELARDVRIRMVAGAPVATISKALDQTSPRSGPSTTQPPGPADKPQAAG